jgi:integrase
VTAVEAEAWIAREMARDSESFDPTRTLGEYLDYWLKLLAGSWGPQTARRYQYEAVALGPELRAIPLWRLRGDRIQRAQQEIIDRGVTRRYAYNVISLLRRALASAVKWKILLENAADTVILPEPEKHETQAWTVEEAKAVLTAVVGHRFEAVYLLILWGGLRIGEVVGLRWDDIADDGTVAFRLAEHTQLKGRPLGSTKRDHDRETQIPAHVVARLKALRAAGPAPMRFPARPRVAVAYVYLSQRPDGNRWTPRAIRDDWKLLVSAVKVGDIAVKQLRPHGGRKTYSTTNMVAGTPLADLSSLMGHSSPAVTAGSYLATSKERRLEAAERLARLLAPEEGTPPGTEKGQGEGQTGP